MSDTTENSIIDTLNARIVDNCSRVDKEQRFCDMLDEIYSFEKVGGPFEHMQASRVLREVDPIAYRCGLSDHGDDDLVEIDGDHYEESDADEQREDLQSELESEIADLEGGADDDNERPGDADRAERRGRQLVSLQAQIATLKAHVWDR